MTCLTKIDEVRKDFSMLLGLVFLLIVGAGAWSADARYGSKAAAKEEERNTTK